MSHGSKRALILKVLALPSIVGIGVLGWQIPQGKGRPAPRPRPSGAPGAAGVGTTAYKVPGGALVVSPSGRDGAAGTEKDPLRTVAAAIEKAHSKDTIVLRGGTYHETVT